jgi:hypothetical protein
MFELNATYVNLNCEIILRTCVKLYETNVKLIKIGETVFVIWASLMFG